MMIVLLWLFCAVLVLWFVVSYTKKKAIPVWIPIVGAAVTIGVITAYSLYDHKRQNILKNSVIVTVAYDLDSCPVERPLNITFENTYSKPTKNISFDVSGYRTGYSKPIYGSYVIEYETDKIILPNTKFQNCWHVPKVHIGVTDEIVNAVALGDIDWRITNLRPQF